VAPAGRLAGAPGADSVRPLSWVRDRLFTVAGGRERAKAIVLLAAVLSLASADLGAVGAAAPVLVPALHLDATEVGLLVSLSSLAAGVATVPVGVLADRRPRVPMLAASIVLWSAGAVACGVAGSFAALLVVRLALGAVTATAGPTVASLTGDLFPDRERSHVYGLILTGELAGSGVGFFGSGTLAGLVGWPAAFWWLAVPGLVLSWLLWRRLPEPERGSAGLEATEGGAVADAPRTDRRTGAGGAGAATRDTHHRSLAARLERERGTEPHGRLLLDGDDAELGLAGWFRYVLRVRTNVILIVSSAIGYFFFAGLHTFGLLFVRAHFGLGQLAATSVLVVAGVGAAGGVLAGGRLADRLVRSGRLNARVAVAACSHLAAAVLFVPVFAIAPLAPAVVLYTLAIGLLTAANPPLDAARLDIMPARLWGRAESVRTVLRTLAVGIAPAAFGLLADRLGGGVSPAAALGGHGAAPHGGAADAPLQTTFLVMLVPLAVSALVLLLALASYPRDVVTAAASEGAGRVPTRRGRRFPAPFRGRQEP
jgi:predicted MFS family arabinose efflux permease